MVAENDKPAHDEQTLAKFLEAAYVLQEHNRELQNMERTLELKRDQLEAEDKPALIPARAAAPTQSTPPEAKADYSSTLAQIVETQHQIHIRHLNLEEAMALTTERLLGLAGAGGAAVGTLDGSNVRYTACTGAMTLREGTEVPMEKALCLACLRTGQVMRCADVNPEFLVDGEECERRGIQSLIAVPVFHNGKIAGGLELYYPRTQAFTEQDVHSCQLMAGLMTEALSRNEEARSKKSLAAERALMMEALERLKPSLAALVDRSAAKTTPARISSAAAVSGSSRCRNCGHKLVGEEQFCGKCGSPRGSAYEPPRAHEPSNMDGRVEPLLQMQETKHAELAVDAAHGGPSQQLSPENFDRDLSEVLGGSVEEPLPEVFPGLELLSDITSDSKSDSPTPLPQAEAHELENPREQAVAIELRTAPEQDAAAIETTALATTEHHVDWSSAASARSFLEQLALAERGGAFLRFWNARRGDIYLAIAVILVACVIRWGIWSHHSIGATGNPAAAVAAHHSPAPDADLSLFDRTLISLGLAEAPPAPDNKGNPDTQVWVDLHSALYYCPGADLYGKTPKGKFTSQRDAQLDQFEPAYRKACD